jgi:hypothetical protein
MAKRPAAAATQPPEPTETNRERLSRLLADIDAHNHHLMRETLFERLVADEGMIASEAKNGSGVWTIRLAGLKAQSTAGRFGALSNWAMNARRALLDLAPSFGA